MRKLLTYILIMIATVCFSQTIPNGDFEIWETRDHFQLDGWYSPTRNVERTTDAKVGNYALKLTNTYSATGNGTRGYVRTTDYGDRQALDGLPTSGDPLSVVFWSKHELATGDTARAYIIFRENGSYRGKIDFRFTGSTNGEFVKYSVPIEWSGARTPDSAWIFLYSYVNNKVNGDGYVIFDDLHFDKIGERISGVLNSDFENWTNIGVDYPDGWRPIDLASYENNTSFLANKSVYKLVGEDAFLGGTSLLIKNYDNNGSPRAGYCYLGTENNDYYTPHFPFTDTFKYLQGYYKYLPAGDDTARINFRAWQEGRSRSYNDLYLHEPKSEWTFFSMPIVYDASRHQPDSAAIIMWSTSTDSIHGFNSSLYLDHLELVMEPAPLKLSVYESSLAFKIFPNPAGDVLFLNSNSKKTLNPNIQCWAVNVQGQKTPLGTEIDSQQARINTAELGAGMYFLYINDGSSFSKPLKFIKK